MTSLSSEVGRFILSPAVATAPAAAASPAAKKDDEKTAEVVKEIAARTKSQIGREEYIQDCVDKILKGRTVSITFSGGQVYSSRRAASQSARVLRTYWQTYRSHMVPRL